MVDGIFPVYSADTVVVPIPTIAGDIRIRRHDYAQLLAKEFARVRKIRMKRCFSEPARIFTLSLKKLRRKQASRPFVATNRKLSSVTCLPVDDITPNGAAFEYAAMALNNLGAKTV